MEDGQITKIDNLLVECKNKGFISYTLDSPEDETEAIRTLKILGFSREKSKSSYELTELGFNVIASGGYLKYLEKVESDKELDREIKRYSLKELKGNIFQLKHWWWIIVINAIISGLVTLIFQLLFHQS